MKKELVTLKMSDLVPYPGNPRRNNKSAKIVAKSIEAYGYISPIIVSEENVILAGNTRFKALQILKKEEVEVVKVYGLTPEQIEGFVIADNRVGEYSQWNYAQIDRLMEGSTKKDEFVTKELGLSSFQDNKSELEDLINNA